MIVKASGRSALIVATGLFVLCVSPIQAETEVSAAVPKSENAGAPPTTVRKHVRHQRKVYAQHKPAPTEAKPDPGKVENQPPAASVTTDNSKVLPEIPPSVANANAQLLLAGVQLSAVSAIPIGNDASRAFGVSPAAKADDETLVAAADQLNDTDRSLQEGGQPSATMANPAPAQAATSMTSERSVWDQTSLIGKIFIGFGALLTMASAARMFIA